MFFGLGLRPSGSHHSRDPGESITMRRQKQGEPGLKSLVSCTWICAGKDIREQLEAQLEEQGRELEELQERILKLQQRHRETSDLVQSTADHMKQLSSANTALKQREQELSDRADNAEHRCEQLHKENQELRAEMQAQLQELQQLKEELSLLEERNSENLNDIDRLHSQVYELQKQCKPQDSPGPMLTFEPGFGSQEQRSLINSLSLAAESLAAGIMQHWKDWSEPVSDAVKRCVPDGWSLCSRIPDKGLKLHATQYLVQHTVIHLALQLASGKHPGQVPNRMAALDQLLRPQDRAAVVAVLTAAASRSYYLAGEVLLHPTGCSIQPSFDSLESQLVTIHTQLYQELATELKLARKHYLVKDAITRLVTLGMQVILLCRSLHSQYPGCTVVCGGPVSQEWNHMLDEPPVKHIPVPGVNRPVVLAYVRPKLVLELEPRTPASVLVRSQVVCLAPIPAEADTPPPPQLQPQPPGTPAATAAKCPHARMNGQQAISSHPLPCPKQTTSWGMFGAVKDTVGAMITFAVGTSQAGTEPAPGRADQAPVAPPLESITFGACDPPAPAVCERAMPEPEQPAWRMATQDQPAALDHLQPLHPRFASAGDNAVHRDAQDLICLTDDSLTAEQAARSADASKAASDEEWVHEGHGPDAMDTSDSCYKRRE